MVNFIVKNMRKKKKNRKLYHFTVMRLSMVSISIKNGHKTLDILKVSLRVGIEKGHPPFFLFFSSVCFFSEYWIIFWVLNNFKLVDFLCQNVWTQLMFFKIPTCWRRLCQPQVTYYRVLLPNNRSTKELPNLGH